jgi:hypothetical protein
MISPFVDSGEVIGDLYPQDLPGYKGLPSIPLFANWPENSVNSVTSISPTVVDDNLRLEILYRRLYRSEFDAAQSSSSILHGCRIAFSSEAHKSMTSSNGPSEPHAPEMASTPGTHEALYELVWFEPMRKVAPRYGVSG